MRTVLSISFFALCASGLAGQEYTQDFSTSVNGVPPGWTIQNGRWRVSGGRLFTDRRPAWQFATIDAFKPRNCVIDLDLVYGSSGVQFGGPVVRFTSETDNLTAKAQENDPSTRGFDNCYIYEQPNSAASGWSQVPLSQDLPGTVRTRFVVKDDTAVYQLDFDNDGIFDQTLERTLTSVLGAGLLGVCIYGRTQIDSFKYYNAVLQPAAKAKPRVGTTFIMDFQSSRIGARPWRLLLSAGDSGFALGTRRIPLDMDPLFNFSVSRAAALGFVGSTDALGRAQPAMNVPNDPNLVGFRIYAAAVTLDGTQPEGVDRISNPIAIQFEQ